MTYAFAAAGTGGHVYPALAVADELVSRGVDRSKIVFFGGDRMEATTVPRAGYEFVPVEIHGLRRSMSADNLKLPGLVMKARGVIEEELSRRKATAVTVFGGYVSVPAAWAGKRVGTKVFLHEQNAAPGLANKLITRFADRSFVAFPAAASQLKNTSLVGNPMRRSITSFDRNAIRNDARRRYDVRADSTVLGVLGGSLGAKVLNEATHRIVADADPEKVAIVHLTGAAHFESLETTASQARIPWRTLPFEQDMEQFYAAVDLVLGRSGALTVSELAATGTPAVVVPLAATNQGANAEHVAAVGGMVIVDEADIDRVPFEIQQLLVDSSRREAMGAAALTRALPGAAGAMADVLMGVRS